MATMNPNWETIKTITNGSGDGNLIRVAEVLSYGTPLVDDMLVKPANRVTTHTFRKRGSLASWDFYKFGGGKGVKKNTTDPDGSEGMAQAGCFSQVPDSYKKAYGDKFEAYRRQEDEAILEGGAQAYEDLIIYGNTVGSPEKIIGLAPRLNALSGASVTDEKSRVCVYNCGGTGGNLTSIYMVQWSPTTVYGIVPPGVNSGVQFEDLGRSLITDPNDATKQMTVWTSDFDFTIGLVVERFGSIRRICNIKTTGTSNTFDQKYLIQAMNEFPMNGNGVVIYMANEIKTQIELLAEKKSNTMFKPGEIFGVNMPMTFRGTNPIRICESISTSETAVS